MALLSRSSTTLHASTTPRVGFSVPRPAAATAPSQQRAARHPITCARHRCRSVRVVAGPEGQQHLTRHQCSQLAVVAALAAVLNSKDSRCHLSAAPLAAPAAALATASVTSSTSHSNAISNQERSSSPVRPRRDEQPASVTVARIATRSTAQFMSSRPASMSLATGGTAAFVAAAGVVAAAEVELDVIPTSWSAFQKANKGKGYSPSQMGQLWREHKARHLTTTTNSRSMRSTANPSALVQTVALGAAMPVRQTTTASPQPGTPSRRPARARATHLQ